MLQRITVLSLLLFPLACSSTPSIPELPQGEAIGEPIDAQAVVRFAKVHADPSSYFERTLLVEANATAVCQVGQCWMNIEDEGSTARVRWETGCGGKYSFPLEAAGKRVLVQGSFYPKQLSDEEYEHLQEEAGPGVEIERDGYEFNATAVLVLAE